MTSKKRIISLTFVFLIAFFAPQVLALSVTDGEEITTTTGGTTSVLEITDTVLPLNGTITIDISALHSYVGGGTFTDANVGIEDTAVATWSGSVVGDVLVLTSNGNATVPGEEVMVTFTGDLTPWISDTGGLQIIPLLATRTDDGETAPINFFINITPPEMGLAILDGDTVTTATGESTAMITIMGTDIPAEGILTIDVSALNDLVASGNFYDANIVVSSDSPVAWWLGYVSNNILYLISANDATTVGDTVQVTFTGAMGNPWVSNSYGRQSIPLKVTREDTGDSAPLNFTIDTKPSGLSIADGEMITERMGATSSIITIIDQEIEEGGTIVIDIAPLHSFVANYTFTDANIQIEDTAIAATWTGTVEGDLLTLSSIGGITAVDETIILTFTGANGSPWTPDTGGAISSSILTATRMDTGDLAFITFIIETMFGPGGLTVAPGEKITTVNGSTSMVLTVTDASLSEYDSIGVDLSGLFLYTSSGVLTEENLAITDTAEAANWTGTLYYDTLLLTPSGGPTEIDETVTITFTGVGGNPWIPTTGGEQTAILMPYRTDNYAITEFSFVIETTLPPGLGITEGAKITSVDGNTTSVITILDSEIPSEGSITIDVLNLGSYVAQGTLTDANVAVADTAAEANWTVTISGDTLILISSGGPTGVGDNITVTFTGTGDNPWIPNTHGVHHVPLVATRTDILTAVPFNLTIETAPPPGYSVIANFSASPRTEMVPLQVAFTDTSLGNPGSWNWDFGDGGTSVDQHPTHTYTSDGVYTVTLTAVNDYGSDTKTQWNYIHALRGGVQQANSSLNGLIVTDCEGSSRSILIDTSVLPVVLYDNNTILEIQPPEGAGFAEIIFYSDEGEGFFQNGDLITGHLMKVHLVSKDLAPSLGFSDYVGINASFTYSMDLASYPCGMILTTKIWEGILPDFDSKLLQLSSANSAVPIGTAYMATITKTNVPTGVPVRLHLCVNPNWNPSLSAGPGNVFIWRIADDLTSGQILPTNHLGTNPLNELDCYTANSSDGLSTVGLSSFTGNNNPFQLISFIIKEIAASLHGGDGDSSGFSGSAIPLLVPPAAATTTINPVDTPTPTGTETMVIPSTEIPIEKIETPVPTTPPIDPLGGFFVFLGKNPVFIGAIGAIAIFVLILEAKFHLLRRKDYQYLDTLPAEKDLSGLDQQRVLSGIIGIFDEMNAQLKQLDIAVKSRAPEYGFSPAEANVIIGKFFALHQTAEGKIRVAAGEGQISKEQIDFLAGQLEDIVIRMVDVSQKSPELILEVRTHAETLSASLVPKK